MISVEYSEAIVEVLDILNHSDDNIIEKIPKKLIKFWKRNKSTTYKPNLDHSKSISEMELKNKTKSIITMIYLNYLCNDAEKNNIKLILKDNEEKYQQELREKYNPDNMFKNKKEDSIVKEETQALVEYKERTFIQKFFDKIKSLFKIK